MAITITTKIEHGYTVYNFEANNTSYELLTQDGKAFDVYSHRIGTGFAPTLKCYNSLTELAARSKALANFVKLIEG